MILLPLKDTNDSSPTTPPVALVHRAQRLSRIFNQGHPITVAQISDGIHLPALPIEVDHDNRLDLRLLRQGLFQQVRVHVPGVRLAIDKHWLRTTVTNRIGAGSKGEARADHRIARPDPQDL